MSQIYKWWKYHSQSTPEPAGELKIVRTPEDIVEGKLYQYNSTLTRSENIICHLFWGRTMLHYLVGVQTEADGPCFVDLNTGRGEYGIRIVSLPQLHHKTIYEVDDTRGMGGRACRPEAEVARLALEATTLPHSYKLFTRNCATFAFYCKLNGTGLNPESNLPVPAPTFGQRKDIHLVRI